MDKSDHFVAPWWLRNPHVQTIWRHLQRTSKLDTLHECLELPDGDFIDLNWTQGSSGPIVILLHGLQGSVNSSYARAMLHVLQRLNLRGVFMHFRGCSGRPNRMPRFYHAGETGDFNFLVETLQRREPHTPLAAIGYSLGGNVLLKWLGERKERASLACAVAVSVPFELANAIARLEQGLSKLYQRRLLYSLRDSVINKFKDLPAPIDFGDLRQLRTLRAYDDKVTAPLHGFAGAQDYYARSSCRQYLKDIRVPTLILHAADDPFMTAQAIPQAHELSSSVHLEVSANGGHVGFISGKYPWRPRYWLEQRIAEFLISVLHDNAVKSEIKAKEPLMCQTTSFPRNLSPRRRGAGTHITQWLLDSRLRGNDEKDNKSDLP